MNDTVMPTGLFDRCSQFSESIVNLPVSAAEGLVSWSGMASSIDLSLGHITGQNFSFLSRERRAHVMACLEATNVNYTWRYQALGAWVEVSLKLGGDVAFLAKLLQCNEKSAFSFALMAHLSEEAASNSQYDPQDILEKLAELSPGVSFVDERMALDFLRFTIFNQLAEPAAIQGDERPVVARKSEALDAAGTLLRIFMSTSIGTGDSRAFKTSLDAIPPFRFSDDDSEAARGVAYGVFISACMKLATEVSSTDQKRREFWTGLSDSFFSILAAGVGVACPPAAVGVAAAGAIIHMIVVSAVESRNFSRAINKMRSDMRSDAMDRHPLLVNCGQEDIKAVYNFIMSQSFLSQLETAILGNGFS